MKSVITCEWGGTLAMISFSRISTSFHCPRLARAFSIALSAYTAFVVRCCTSHAVPNAPDPIGAPTLRCSTSRVSSFSQRRDQLTVS